MTPKTLTDHQTRQARAAAHGLGGAATTVVDAVRRVVGLQAQDVRANRLAVRVRTSGLTARDVDDACRRRVVVRTWAMRGTLHMLAAEDLGWVNGLLGPLFDARGARRRRQLGLDDDLLERAAAAVDTILDGAALTRAELVEQLADHGVVLDPRSQGPAHLVAHVARTGQVCRGADTDRDEPTYVLVRDWLGPQRTLDEPAALARLAERYLAGHGPATAADLATWSGLPAAPAREAINLIADRLEAVTAAGESAWVLAGPGEPPAPTRLLGHFDAYLLGYRGRELAVPDEHRQAIQAGGGFVMPAVLVAGRVVGTWRLKSTKDSLAVEASGFGEESMPDLREEVSDLERFFGKPGDT
ncbi:MAG TPA: winged helix DNA-binding domain-containing protein [Actinophytocola sp.]|nr:winged helix DNA-binding domain-containing protein [Actinophytocola sp.]